MAYTGFTILLWVKEDSPLIVDSEGETYIRQCKQLIQDANILLGMRWNMEMSICTMGNNTYGFGANTRITVSNTTIRNALGTLTEHVDFLRGNPNNTCDDLVNYRMCKLKWSVPDQVTESGTSGWEVPGRDATSAASKRRHY